MTPEELVSAFDPFYVKGITEFDPFCLFTDEALIGELVKRGVLHKSRRMMPATPTERWVPFERFATGWEPVGSVEGEG